MVARLNMIMIMVILLTWPSNSKSPIWLLEPKGLYFTIFKNVAAIDSCYTVLQLSNPKIQEIHSAVTR